jgi:hypothetical protein
VSTAVCSTLGVRLGHVSIFHLRTFFANVPCERFFANVPCERSSQTFFAISFCGCPPLALSSFQIYLPLQTHCFFANHFPLAVLLKCKQVSLKQRDHLENTFEKIDDLAALHQPEVPPDTTPQELSKHYKTQVKLACTTMHEKAKESWACWCDVGCLLYHLHGPWRVAPAGRKPCPRSPWERVRSGRGHACMSVRH